MRIIKLRYLLPAITLLVGFATMLLPTPSPARAVPADKVTVCHAGDAATNPYQVNEPAKSADVGGHNGHTGPVAYSEAYAEQLKKDGIKWGDIIPPFTYPGGSYPGLNWTEVGQSIWNNDCKLLEPVVPAAVTFVTATCADPDAVLSYTIPKTDGVEYYVDGKKVKDGTYTEMKKDDPIVFGDTITVTAKLKDEKKTFFPPGTVTEWTQTFTEPDCEVMPAAVTFTAPTCTVSGSYVIPTTAHVYYVLGVNTVTAGSYPATNGSTVTINANAETNYFIDAATTSSWTNTFTAPTNCTSGNVLGTSTTTTPTTAVAGASTQVTSAPAGAVDAGESSSSLTTAVLGLIGSTVVLGLGAVLQRRTV